MDEQKQPGRSPRRLPVPPGASPSPSPLGTGAAPGTPGTPGTPSESKSSTPRRHLPAPPLTTLGSGGTPASPRVRRRLAKTNGASPSPAEANGDTAAREDGGETTPAVAPQEAGRQSVLAWLRSRDARGVRAPEPKYLVVGEAAVMDALAAICRERAAQQIPVSWTSVNIELMEAFGNTTIMTLQDRIEEHIVKCVSDTEGWLQSDPLMVRLRELCDAAVTEHGAVKYDELMGTLNDEFGPATVQERQEPIKKAVTAYPGLSIVRSQNL